MCRGCVNSISYKCSGNSSSRELVDKVCEFVL